MLYVVRIYGGITYYYTLFMHIEASAPKILELYCHIHKLQFEYVYTCAHVRVHVCVCVSACFFAYVT